MTALSDEAVAELARIIEAAGVKPSGRPAFLYFLQDNATYAADGTLAVLVHRWLDGQREPMTPAAALEELRSNPDWRYFFESIPSTELLAFEWSATVNDPCTGRRVHIAGIADDGKPWPAASLGLVWSALEVFWAALRKLPGASLAEDPPP